MKGQHEEWISRAENDLQFAEVGQKEGFYSQVCFLSQQSVEKSLKGVLVALGRSYPKTHSLRELAKLISEINFEKLFESLTVLDGYYVPLRYPDAAAGTKMSGPPNKDEAGEALETARAVFNLVTKYISKL